MPIYHSSEKSRTNATRVPQERRRLYAEELIGNKGFTGPSSLLYHLHQPTPDQSAAPI